MLLYEFILDSIILVGFVIDTGCVPTLCAQVACDVVEPLSINTEIKISDSAAGANLYPLGVEALDQSELDVVDIPVFQALELGVHVILLTGDDLEAASVDARLTRLVGIDGRNEL
ncbi:unnamed protein product [Pseudo-nitzschia multistriata]|uniref:Uncharacterized protein n=1 Tax=Pseudo-nitzschia multistriata TaxID=183589 RepID=A0A448YX76_9STRA|nr:unnamed protein product [Pseudo-nitzschia multistriata]